MNTSKDKRDQPMWHDDSKMPFGKWRGTRLGSIPDSYWQWLLEQDWAYRDYPELIEYAETIK